MCSERISHPFQQSAHHPETSATDYQAAPADETSRKEAEVGLTAAALYQRLGWEHWARAERSRMRKSCPPSYPLF
jgi:hypothetical protein